jgi:hypothetical protein
MKICSNRNPRKIYKMANSRLWHDWRGGDAFGLADGHKNSGVPARTGTPEYHASRKTRAEEAPRKA